MANGGYLGFCFRTIRKAAQEKGLNLRLPKSYPLVQMYSNILKISHGDNSTAADNYVANVARVLMYVHQHLETTTKVSPRHWSQLVSGDVHVFCEFIEK